MLVFSVKINGAQWQNNFFGLRECYALMNNLIDEVLPLGVVMRQLFYFISAPRDITDAVLQRTSLPPGVTPKDVELFKETRERSNNVSNGGYHYNP